MLVKKRYIIAASVLAFLLFVGFSYLVHKDFFTQIDFNATVRFQDHITRKLDGVFSLLSTIGNFEVTGALLLLFLIFRRKLNGIFVALSFGFFHFFELYGKTFVEHLPPPHFMLRTERIGNFPQFYVSAENSYPSGHSARALFVTAVLAFFTLKSTKLNSTQKIIIYSALTIYDITMLISRIYLGEHWTSDVIGGSLLGLSFAIFSLIFV